MSFEVFRAFAEWASASAGKLEQAAIAVSPLASAPAGETEVRYADVVVDRGELVGRIRLTQSGKCEVQALYASTGNWIIMEEHNVASPGDLHNVLDNYVSQIQRPKT